MGLKHILRNSWNETHEKNKINVTIRREMGRDIDGACGQLRRRHMNENGEVRCD